MNHLSYHPNRLTNTSAHSHRCRTGPPSHRSATVTGRKSAAVGGESTVQRTEPIPACGKVSQGDCDVWLLLCCHFVPNQFPRTVLLAKADRLRAIGHLPSPTLLAVPCPKPTLVSSTRDSARFTKLLVHLARCPPLPFEPPATPASLPMPSIEESCVPSTAESSPRFRRSLGMFVPLFQVSSMRKPRRWLSRSCLGTDMSRNFGAMPPGSVDVLGPHSIECPTQTAAKHR